MKTLKRLAVAFALFAGLGVVFASCSEDVYYEDPVNPIEQIPVNPIGPVPEQTIL